MERPSTIEHKEQKAANKVINFYELSVQEKADLEKRLAQNRGIAIGLVHPNYQNSKKSEAFIRKSFPPERPLSEVKKQFEALLANIRPDGPPVFVFEGAKSVEKAIAEAKSYLQKIGSTTFVVPTYTDWPEPRGSFQGLSSSDRGELAHRLDSHFDELGFSLRKLGVAKMYFAGMNLGIHAANPAYDQGCVLNAMENLKPYIPEIKLAAFSWPSSRQTLRNNPGRLQDYAEYI